MPTNETTPASSATASASASASAAMPTDTSISKGTILTTATTGTKSTNNDDDEKSLGAVAEDGGNIIGSNGSGGGGGGGDCSDGDDDEEDADSIGVVAPPAGDYYDEPDFTPPLRIHATRVPERLTGSSSNLFQGSEPNLLSSSSSALGANRRRTSDPTISMTLGGSRSRSESPYRQRGGSRGGGGGSGANSMSNQFDGGSSISSLEDAGFDTDILTGTFLLISFLVCLFGLVVQPTDFLRNDTLPAKKQIEKLVSLTVSFLFYWLACFGWDWYS